MGTVSFTGSKTCLVCGKPLPPGWRDDVHRECALSGGESPTKAVPRISNRFTVSDERAILADLKTGRPTADIAAQYGADEETILSAGKGTGRPDVLPKSTQSQARIGLYDGIERLVREGKTKEAIAQELHTSWETITKVCKERNLTPVRGRGKPITIKARRKPETKPEPAPPTALDKVQRIRERRRNGAEINELAIEFSVLPSTVEMLCEGVEPAAPGDPVTAPTPIEKENAVPDTTICELDAARDLVSAREKAYQAKFGELAVAALTGETPDLTLLRLAYEYGFAVGGYQVLAAMEGTERDMQ